MISSRAMHRTFIMLCAIGLSMSGSIRAEKCAEIQVLDEVTRRPVPLVELETVDGIAFTSDNVGRMAVADRDLLDRETFFSLRGHGYEVPADGFGIRGVRLKLRAGERSELLVKRNFPAERLVRLTGEGLYAESERLGYETPNTIPRNGRVAGQDSVFTVPVGDRLLWLWGDTAKREYPLGLFRTAGATTPLYSADKISFNPERGVPYEYFVDRNGFARAMMPLAQRPEGVVWIHAPFTLRDREGVEQVLAHYSRRKDLATQLEHGIAKLDREQMLFEPLQVFPNEETWRHPAGQVIRFTEADGVERFLFGAPSAYVRVEAKWDAVLDPSKYEALAWRFTGDRAERVWQREVAPTDSAAERKLQEQGKLTSEQVCLAPLAGESNDRRITLHRGSVAWNAYQKCWIMIASRHAGDDSFLGEVWYAQAAHPSGPFRRAVKIASHEKQSFYNPVHHPFFDGEGGRIIFFEGTYTNTFSGNPRKTPRYEYNQLLYRLDLTAEELSPARKE